MCHASAVICCFVKQKTAYDMRISDWSSDVCSSDLFLARGEHELQRWGVDDINPGGPRIRSIDFFDRRQSTGDLDAVKIDARLIHEVIAAPKDADPATIPFLDAMGSLEAIFARQKLELGRASCRERVCQYV